MASAYVRATSEIIEKANSAFLPEIFRPSYPAVESLKLKFKAANIKENKKAIPLPSTLKQSEIASTFQKFGRVYAVHKSGKTDGKVFGTVLIQSNSTRALNAIGDRIIEWEYVSLNRETGQRMNPGDNPGLAMNVDAITFQFDP